MSLHTIGDEDEPNIVFMRNRHKLPKTITL
jgi:hypothetical protein